MQVTAALPSVLFRAFEEILATYFVNIFQSKKMRYYQERNVSIQNLPSCHFTKKPYMTGFI